MNKAIYSKSKYLLHHICLLCKLASYTYKVKFHNLPHLSYIYLAHFLQLQFICIIYALQFHLKRHNDALFLLDPICYCFPDIIYVRGLVFYGFKKYKFLYFKCFFFKNIFHIYIIHEIKYFKK